jgi:hypothetical protein
VPYLEQQFAPDGVGVVVVRDNAAAVDGMDRKEENAAIIVAEGNDAMGLLSLSPPPLISIPPTMSVLLYSPVAPLLRPFKPGMGGGIDKMTPKEGESNQACPAISFFGGGGFSLVIVS